MRSFCATNRQNRLRELGEREQTSFDFHILAFFKTFCLLRKVPYLEEETMTIFIEYQNLNCFGFVLRAPATDSNGSQRKMTASLGTFRMFHQKQYFSKIWVRILRKTSFLRRNEGRQDKLGYPALTENGRHGHRYVDIPEYT